MGSKHKNLHTHNKGFCLYSPSLEEGQSLPTKFTKFGINMSPELCWHGIPRGTKSFVLIFDCPSAESDHGKPIVHWMVINIPSSLRILNEDQIMSRIYNASEINNDFGYQSYYGPWPINYRNHKYIFTLFALSVSQIDLHSCLTAEQFKKFMNSIIIDHVKLVTRYKKKQEKYQDLNTLNETPYITIKEDSKRSKKKMDKMKKNENKKILKLKDDSNEEI